LLLLCLPIAIRGRRYLSLPQSLCNRAVQDHLRFRDWNRNLQLPEFYCGIVSAVPNGKGESCDHILELIDRKTYLFGRFSVLIEVLP